MPYDKTYRVQGIPATLSRKGCKKLLNSILKEDNENPDITVHSLGPDPCSSECNALQIATITFGQVPKRLRDNANEWIIPVPSGNENGVSSIIVDVHFLGFTPLNSIKNSPDHNIDCIAITGLNSHPFGSWKQRNGQHMWLRDCLPHDLKGTRVLLYGYDTGLLQSQSFQNVDDIAVGFSKGIRSIRMHKAIIEMKNGDDIEKENFTSIYGILFFGVPNQGIRIEHWLPMVQGQPNENLIRDLGHDSTYLRELHENFWAAFTFPDSEIVSIYETERTRVVKEEEPGKWALTGNYEILVSVNSATDNRPKGRGYQILPIKKNHSDMVKFSSRSDQNYKLIVSQLKEFSANATKVIRARFLKSQTLQVACILETPRHHLPICSAGMNANRQSTDNEGWTPLHHAASQGYEDILKELAMQISIEERDTNGRIPLHIAACYGHDAVVEILLDINADKDARNCSEQTPLCNAASRGHLSIVKMLVDKRANLEAKDTEGKTPLYSAARYGHEAVARLLVERGANKEAKAIGGWTSLHAAAWYGHEAVVRALVESGADTVATADNGETPLHSAVQNGHETVSTLLLGRGASIEARSKSGETPLHVAAEYGREAVARLLVDKQPNTEARNSDGKTPLYIAARAGHEKVTRLLVERGANTNMRTRGGWTPLHAAAWYGHELASRVLVESDADMESRSEDGETPLFVAARHGRRAVVRLLATNGADIKAQARGVTPLKIAKRNGYTAVVNELRSFHN